MSSFNKIFGGRISMTKFLNWIEFKLMPPMARIAEQRHLKAIRNGVISTLSLVLIGSFFMVFANIPIPAVAEFLAPYTADIVVPYRITMGLMAVYASFAMGYNLAKSYKLDGITGGILSLAAFFMLTIPMNVDASLPADSVLGWVMPMQYLGGAGMFSAILTMIFAVETYRFFTRHKITIKMPEQVPPAVARSFEAMIPGAVIIITLWIIRVLLKFDINELLLMIFRPLSNIMGNNYFGILLPMLLIHVLWAAGVHGMSIVGSIVRPMWLLMLDDNAAAVANGASLDSLPYIAPEQFYQWTVTIGGAGTTLVLCLLLAFTCKSTFLRQVGRFSLIPGIFNINEPLIFGVPLIMNPILAIPFVLNPLLLTTTSYFAVKLGLVNGFIANVPWTLPAPIGAYLSAGNDWRAILLVLVNLGIAGVVYYPFVKVYDRKMIEQEGASPETEQNDLSESGIEITK